MHVFTVRTGTISPFLLPHNIHNVGYAKQLQTATVGITSRRVFTAYWYAEESVD